MWTSLFAVTAVIADCAQLWPQSPSNSANGGKFRL